MDPVPAIYRRDPRGGTLARYFVTGATGFVGGRLVRQLRAAGHEVVTIVRDPSRAADLQALGVEVHRGDITDRASLIAPMRGVDGAFHLAAWYKIGANATERRTAWTINVGGTRNVLDVMGELGIAKGVHTSTLAVFGDTHGKSFDESHRENGPWLTEYDRTKWAAHYEVAEPAIRAGLPLVIVMSGVIYGPGDHSQLHTTIVQYLTRRLPALPIGNAFCWAHVDDIAHGHILAMDKGRAGETYIIAGPRHSTIEAFELAERVTGVPAPRLHLAPVVLRSMATAAGLIERVMPLPESYTREGLMVTAGVTYLGDNTKARRELGYAPRSLAEGWPPTLEAEMRALGMKA